MSNEVAGAAVLFLVGLALGGIVVRRIVSGKSYSYPPPMQVTRQADPFSFWLSLLFPTVFGLLCIVPAIVWVFQALRAH